jgi:hypothetical protein
MLEIWNFIHLICHGYTNGYSCSVSITIHHQLSCLFVDRAGYTAATMAADLSAGVGLSVSIAIPTVPTSFYPGATPVKARLG